MPDPSRARDVSEFVRLLDEARINAGRPSYRTIAKRVGPLMRPPRVVAYSTVSDLFKVGRRRLDLDLVVAIVRCLGVAESEVARWRDACVRVHADAKSGGPTGVFRQLPHDLSTFVGHERLLAELVAALTPRVAPSAPATAVAVVEGMAGVGKTQLAVHAAHALVRDGWYPDGQLYVNLRGFDPVDRPTDAATVLESFLRALEVPATQIPADPGERAAMFRDRVHDRRMLILLDNAADEDQVRDLIPAGPACRVLITSRRCLLRLDGAERYVVEPFSAPEAVGLLARIAGDGRIAAEPEAARSVAARCGGLPLAVALSAARLRSRPLWTVADLDSRLRDGGLQKLGSDAVHHTVNLSYRHLAVDTQSLFRALAAVPGPDFDVFGAAAVADLAASEAEALIEDLVDVHLVQQHLPGRYRMHDLVAAHSRRSRSAVPTSTTELWSAAWTTTCIRPSVRRNASRPEPRSPTRRWRVRRDPVHRWPVSPRRWRGWRTNGPVCARRSNWPPGPAARSTLGDSPRRCGGSSAPGDTWTTGMRRTGSRTPRPTRSRTRALAHTLPSASEPRVGAPAAAAPSRS